MNFMGVFFIVVLLACIIDEFLSGRSLAACLALCGIMAGWYLFGWLIKREIER